MSEWPIVSDALFVLALILMFFAYCYGNATLSGWRGLRKRYPDRSALTVRGGLRGQTVRLGQQWGASEYQNSVTVGIDGAGLHLDERTIRIGHSPIVIPWSCIDAVGPVKWFVRTFDTYRIDDRYTVGFPADSTIAALIAPYLEHSVGVRDHR